MIDPRLVYFTRNMLKYHIYINVTKINMVRKWSRFLSINKMHRVIMNYVQINAGRRTILRTAISKCLRLINGWKKVYQKSRNGTQNGKDVHHQTRGLPLEKRNCVLKVKLLKKSRKIERKCVKSENVGKCLFKAVMPWHFNFISKIAVDFGLVCCQKSKESEKYKY